MGKPEKAAHGTEPTRKKLFVVDTGVLVKSGTPLALMVLVSCVTQLTGGARFEGAIQGVICGRVANVGNCNAPPNKDEK